MVEHEQKNIICEYKNKKIKIECDVNIAPLIKELNENGFKTVFSCENSIVKRDGDDCKPYVMIKMPSSKKKVYEFIQMVRKYYHQYGTESVKYNIINHAIVMRMTRKNDYMNRKFDSYDNEPDIYKKCYFKRLKNYETVKF